MITGETGAGKTMVVTALGLLLGGRADSGAVRTGRRAARVEGLVPSADSAARWRRPSTRSAARSRTAGWCWPGRSRPRAARAPSSAAPRCRSSTLAALADPLVAVHGQSDQHRLLQPARPARRARQLRRREDAGAAGPVRRRGYAALRGHRDASSPRWSRPPASGPGRPTCCGSASARSRPVDPQPGEDAALAAEEARLGFADTLRTAAEQARECLSAEDGGPDALGAVSAARKLLDGVREHDPEAAGLADRLAEVSYLLSDVAADVASYASGLETDPARLAAVSERRAALTALTRKYGETIDDVLAWAEHSAAAAARPRRHRRAGSRELPRAARPAPRRARPSRGAALSAARTKAAGPARRARSPASSASLAMPHARLDGRGAPDRRPTTGCRSAGATAAVRPDRASTTSSCCWPPTGAPSRARSARAPPAASCPG